MALCVFYGSLNTVTEFKDILKYCMGDNISGTRKLYITQWPAEKREFLQVGRQGPGRGRSFRGELTSQVGGNEFHSNVFPPKPPALPQ